MSKEELLKNAKPILFNTEMVRAILDGRKTHTRIVVPKIKGKPNLGYCDFEDRFWITWSNNNELQDKAKKIYSKYNKGDILWVREPAEITNLNSVNMTIGYHYGADEWIVNEANKISIPDRFIDMSHTGEIVENFDLIKPKWIRELQGIPNGCIKELARIFLKVTSVRVERLQDIEHEDILADGMDFNTYEMKEKGKLYGNDTHGEVDYCEDLAGEWWVKLWNSTSKDGYKWEDNPYVFVYEFERVEGCNE